MPPTRKRFGIFEIDLETGELYRNGARLKLQEQPFQMLAMLLERPGEVVTREALRERLWPADTFVDFDHGLNTATKKLRQALGDVADNPRFIETLARRGYRFIAPVTVVGTDADTDVPEGGARGDAQSIPMSRKRERLAWAVAALSISVAGALAVSTLYSRRAVPEPLVTQLDVVTPRTTDPFSFALSPDGRKLVFAASSEKGSQLWLRPLDRVAAQPIASTDGASAPFWAPDGTAVGFFADGKLKRIDLTGSGLQVLADAPNPRGGTWSADDVIVFAPGGSEGLVRIAATGGSPVTVTERDDGQGSHRWPQFLPDGRRFLFLMSAGGLPETHGIYVASLDGGEPMRIVPAETAAMYAAPGYLLLVSDGVLVARPFDLARAAVVGEPVPVAQDVGPAEAFRSAFSVSAHGVLAYRAGSGARRQLVWVDRTGKVRGVAASGDGISGPELAVDGQRVTTPLNVRGNIDVWLIDVAQAAPRRFTFDGAIDNRPLWSPDGRQVVFSSTRNGPYDLFVKPASGASAEQVLLMTPQNKAPLDWSRDGRFLLYGTQDPNTASDLWVLPIAGERKPFPVLRSRFDEIGGQFSPDGRLLAYASNESGRYEVYVRTFPEAGGKWQVSAAGGMQPRWKPDGSELFYVAPDAQLTAMTIRMRRDPHAPDGRDSHALDAGTPVTLFPARLATGGNAQATGFQARAQYAVASDGRFLMNVPAEETNTSPITVALNWDAAVKK
jgi:Tol biopolymer transport system component/DNA-binding winged helix-turn-helix (wHTH) protein